MAGHIGSDELPGRGLRLAWHVSNAIRNLYLFAKEVRAEVSRDRGSLFAAAISFFGLISLIPLLLLAIAVFGHIMGSYDNAREQVLAIARDYIPTDITVLEENLKNLSQQSGLLGGLGVLGLLWTGSQVFVIVQQVMDVALGSKRRLGFLRGRLIALAVVAGVGFLFGLSVGITSVLALIRTLDLPVWPGQTRELQFVWDLLGLILPMFISILSFSLAYKFLPTTDVGIKGPLIGGVTAGVLFEVAKHLFRWYVTDIANFGRIYGSLAGIVVLVLWIYYISLITVIGAEVTSVYVRWHTRTETGEAAGNHANI